MTIESTQWQLLAKSKAHKQSLLAYAQRCGLPVPPAMWGWHEDDALFLNYWNARVGIGSLPVRHHADRYTTLIDETHFYQLCEEHQQQQMAASGPAVPALTS